MKNIIFHKAFFSLLLGSVMTLSSCTKISGDEIHNDLFDKYRTTDARLVRLDMDGVKGFAVLGNAPYTKSNTKSDDIPAQYSLYNIDENGQISLSVFYYDAKVTRPVMVTEEDGSSHWGMADDEDTQEIIENELQGAIQLVPSLMTDLGKYILFSGCRFNVCRSDLSEELQQICDMIVERLQRSVKDEFDIWVYPDICHEFLLRKSDGALFDITEQKLFTYHGNGNVNHGLPFWSDNDSASLESIVENTYFIHNDNIYVIDSGYEGVRKIVDNGNAIDVSRVTQKERFDKVVMDKDGNLYALNMESYYGTGIELHSYLAGGGFDIKYFDHDSYVDMDTDNQGNAYLFTKEYMYNTNNELVGKGFIVTSLADGQAHEVYNTGMDFWMFDTDGSYPPANLLRYLENFSELVWTEHLYHRFTLPLKFQNNTFMWLFGGLDHYYGGDDLLYPYYKTWLLKYTPDQNEAQIVDVPDNVKSAFKAQYDSMSLGKVCCGVRVDSTNIEVTQIDILNETVFTNTFVIEALSSILDQRYEIINFTTPTLYIKGRSNITGEPVVISVNLFTGENSASFAGDAREVVTLLRIN